MGTLVEEAKWYGVMYCGKARDSGQDDDFHNGNRRMAGGDEIEYWNKANTL